MAKPRKSPAAQVGKYLGLGLLLPVSSLVGYGIGYFLDRWFGTSFLKIVLLILGSVAGFVQLYRGLVEETGDDGS